MIFYSGAEVANSYKHLFGRDGINSKEEISHLWAVGFQEKGLQDLCSIFERKYEK